MLDLHHGTGQVRSGVGQLLDAKRSVRLIPAGQLRHLAVLHLDILCGRITEQVIQRRYTLIHGVVASQRQRDGHGAVRASIEGANSGSIRTDHLKDGSAQRRVRAFFQLDNFQAGVGHFGFLTIAVITVCGQLHCGSWVGVAHIILELAVLVDLGAGGIEHRILIDISREGKLDAAGLACHRSGGI